MQRFNVRLALFICLFTNRFSVFAVWVNVEIGARVPRPDGSAIDNGVAFLLCVRGPLLRELGVVTTRGATSRGQW